MLRQQLVEQLGPRVERKSVMADQAFLLLLAQKLPDVELLVFFIGLGAHRMHQIKVEIPCASPLQTGEKLSLRAFLAVAHHPGVQLRRQQVRSARIALHQRLVRSPLRRPRAVDKRRVEILHSCAHEQIDHRLHLLHVDRAILFGQTHQTKAQLGHLHAEKLVHRRFPLYICPSPRGPICPRSLLRKQRFRPSAYQFQLLLYFTS